MWTIFSLRIYNSYTGGRPLSHKALTQEYWYRVCKKLPKITSENMTSARGTPQAFINQEVP